jgi:hypothetical protein
LGRVARIASGGAVRFCCEAGVWDAHQDLVRSRHRLSKLLLRRGWSRTAGKRNWSQGRLWLRSLRFEYQADRLAHGRGRQGLEGSKTRLATVTHSADRL